MKERKGRKWMEIRSKVSVDFPPDQRELPNIPQSQPLRPGRDDLDNKKHIAQTRFTSRQRPWLHTKRVISRRDVLTLWETRGPVERYSCRRPVRRGRRGSEDTHKRLARRRKGFITEDVRSERCCYTNDAGSEPRERAQDAIEQERRGARVSPRGKCESHFKEISTLLKRNSEPLRLLPSLLHLKDFPRSSFLCRLILDR